MCGEGLGRELSGLRGASRHGALYEGRQIVPAKHTSTVGARLPAKIVSAPDLSLTHRHPMTPLACSRGGLVGAKHVMGWLTCSSGLAALLHRHRRENRPDPAAFRISHATPEIPASVGAGSCDTYHHGFATVRAKGCSSFSLGFSCDGLGRGWSWRLNGNRSWSGTWRNHHLRLNDCWLNTL